MLHDYYHVIDNQLRRRNNFIITNYDGNKELPFERCNNREDKILKFYHLALLIEDKELANYFQQKIKGRLLKDLSNKYNEGEDLFYVPDIIKIVALIAHATDCFEDLKKNLTQKAEKCLGYEKVDS